MNLEPQMIHEQIAINLESLGIAFRITWYADKLLNAILDDGPKAELIRQLAVDLDRFQLCTVDGDLDDCEKVSEAMDECEWRSARLAFKTLILERDVPEAEAALEYWPGYAFKEEAP
jgi:hypothetical protein